MAERGDEEMSGEDDEVMPGFRFKPKDEELVEYYLLPRLQGRQVVPNDVIVEANVYECHPEKLINENCKNMGQTVWYFLSSRIRKHENGTRPDRQTNDKTGRWKASTGKKEADETVVHHRDFKFCVSSLAYFNGETKTEKKTKWLMREFTIPEFEVKLDHANGDTTMLDEYVLCKIYLSPKNRGHDDEKEDSSASDASTSEPGSVEAGDQGTAAGKRPAEETEQTRGLAAAAKRPYLPAPEPAYGGQAPMPRPPQLMGNGQVPMQQRPVAYNGYQVQQPFPASHNNAWAQRPPMDYSNVPPVHNGGHAPVQAVQRRPMQPQPAYHGEVPVQRGPAVMYHGEVPRQRPPAIYNYRAPIQRPPAIYNYRAPIQRPPAMYNNQPVMMYGGRAPNPEILHEEAPCTGGRTDASQEGVQSWGDQCTNA